MDDEGLAFHAEVDPVERALGSGRRRERRNSRRQPDLERPVDADSLEAGDPEVAGCARGRSGERRGDQQEGKVEAHRPTFLQQD